MLEVAQMSYAWVASDILFDGELALTVVHARRTWQQGGRVLQAIALTGCSLAPSAIFLSLHHDRGAAKAAPDRDMLLATGHERVDVEVPLTTVSLGTLDMTSVDY